MVAEIFALSLASLRFALLRLGLRSPSPYPASATSFTVALTHSPLAIFATLRTQPTRASPNGPRAITSDTLQVSLELSGHASKVQARRLFGPSGAVH